MIRKTFFPLRFKILVAVLFLVTVVVSVITFTMANLFHSDKTTYIHDLTSVIALHTAEETRSLVVGYKEKLQVFSRVMVDKNMPQKIKSDLLKKLFEDFQEFVAVTLYEEGEEKARIFDARQLREAGFSQADLIRYRDQNPLPWENLMDDQLYIENSSLSEKLPLLTLAVVRDIPGEDRKAIVAALIRLDSLLRIATRSKVFETFLIDGKGTLLAHSDLKKVSLRTKVDDIPNMKTLREQKSLGMVFEYNQGGVSWVAGFSPVGLGDLLAGVQIPKTTAYLTARELLNNLVVISLGLLVVSAVLGLFWSRRITKPIEGLSKAAQVVGKGQFDVHLETPSHDEIGELAESFNHMASELNTREKALKQAQSALVHSEKMAAFGQLGAGIAHEVKNPLAGILGYAQLSMRKVEKDSQFYKNLQTIEKEAKRCKTIIENLMKFSRQEKVQFGPTDLNRVVEEAVAIVGHQLSLNQVELEKDFEPNLPPINGNANQIEQVLINLLINAQQAMEGKPGLVKISTCRRESGKIEIRLQDNGPGIPKDVKEKIFEPFYTTKSSGQGTGLGLSVSYGIIQDHKGEIKVESESGKGATFILTLPTDENFETKEEQASQGVSSR